MYRQQLNIQVFILLCLASGLLACSSPKLEKIDRDGTILAFGDSLTVGVGTSRENSYPAVLEKLSGLKVINSGVSGETSAGGLKRLPVELDRIKPDLLILIEGGNDILQNKTPSEIKKNLEAMLLLAKARNIPAVLIGVPKKNLFSSCAPLYKELAEEYDLVFDCSLIGNLQRSPSSKSDYVHFNEKGYREMAESIHELLKQSGAL